MKSAPVTLLNLESLKFHLVQNSNLSPVKDKVSLEEVVEYLVESLEEADAASAERAENLLVRIGKPTIPSLLKGLKSSSNTVKSVCAMSLIRIGHSSVAPLKEFYARNVNRPKLRWVVEFILGELGEPLPAVEMDELSILQSSKVIELSKVG